MSGMLSSFGMGPQKDSDEEPTSTTEVSLGTIRGIPIYEHRLFYFWPDELRNCTILKNKEVIERAIKNASDKIEEKKRVSESESAQGEGDESKEGDKRKNNIFEGKDLLNARLEGAMKKLQKVDAKKVEYKRR